MAGKKRSKLKSKSKSKKKSFSAGRNGLDMDFIKMHTLSNLSVEERINTILKRVKEGHMVVIDAALTADEEAKLVTATMQGIKGEFTGIEFCTLEKSSSTFYNLVSKFMESVLKLNVTKPGLTFVGPSYLIEKIKRDGADAFYVSTKNK